MDTAITGIDLRDRLQALMSALDAAKACIRADGEAGLEAWIQPPDTELAVSAQIQPSRERICAALGQIYFVDEQDSKSTLTFPGLVAARDDTLQALRVLNDAKDAFAQAVQAVRKQGQASTERAGQLDTWFAEQLQTRDETVHTALTRNGCARLCLKQAYRKVRICGYKDEQGAFIHARPLKLGWAWQNKRSIQKSSIAKLRADVHEQYGDVANSNLAAQTVLHKLAQLNLPDDTLIARVHDNTPRLVANFVIPTGGAPGELVYDERQRLVCKRSQIRADLPIFFPWENAKTLPKFGQVPARKARDPNRLPRADQRLETQPLIDGYPYYLYQGRQAGWNNQTAA